MRILDPKEHGLGHLLNPIDPTNQDKGWIDRIWLMIVGQDAGEEVSEPYWFDLIAASQFTASSTYVLNAFRHFNKDQSYSDQVKPFSFLLSVQIAPLGHPLGYGPREVPKFHLVAPWESDLTRWRELMWVDVYSGNRFAITTSDDADPDGTARVKTYRDVFTAYGNHDEPKSRGPESRRWAQEEAF